MLLLPSRLQGGVAHPSRALLLRQSCSSKNIDDDDDSSLSTSSSTIATEEEDDWRDTLLFQDKILACLAFPVEESLLLGQEQELVLKEGRFLDLLEEHQEGLCGLALVGQDGFETTVVPICRILEYYPMAGYRGKLSIHVRIKVVGRTSLDHVVQMKPYITIHCGDEELMDHVLTKKQDLEEANGLVNKLEETLQSLEDDGNLYQEYLRKMEEQIAVLLDITEKEYSNLTRKNDRPFVLLSQASWTGLEISRSALSSPSSTTILDALACTDIRKRLLMAIMLAKQVKASLS